jgi:hypothetical protein
MCFVHQSRLWRCRRSTVPNLDDLIETDDPTDLFDLHEELAEGSFGVVYKVNVDAC